MEAIQRLIADVPDFPKPGIVFKDITPLLLDAGVTKGAIMALVERAAAMGATRVAGIESRGFIFGVPVALEMDLGFIPLRKPSKLPRKTLRAAFKPSRGSRKSELWYRASANADSVQLCGVPSPLWRWELMCRRARPVACSRVWHRRWAGCTTSIS